MDQNLWYMVLAAVVGLVAPKFPIIGKLLQQLLDSLPGGKKPAPALAPADPVTPPASPTPQDPAGLNPAVLALVSVLGPFIWKFAEDWLARLLAKKAEEKHAQIEAGLIKTAEELLR